MTPEHIHTVQSSWSKVLPAGSGKARLLFERLLQSETSLCGLFQLDGATWSANLVQMIDVLVTGLSLGDRRAVLTRRIGGRNTACPAIEHHYDLIGTALLRTLAKRLRAEFTPKVEAAWAIVYEEVVESLRKAGSAKRARRLSSVMSDARRARITDSFGEYDDMLFAK